MHISYGLVPALAVLAGAQNFTLEAEEAILDGVTVETEFAGYTGTGYVDGFDAFDDKIVFNVNSTYEKLYDIDIRYAAIDGEKATIVAINNQSSEVVLPETDSFTLISGGQVLLEEGANVVEIQGNLGWYFIDSIHLSPAAPREEYDIEPGLVNRNANEDAMALYNYLSSVYGEHVLSGQQDLRMVEWLEENVGVAPAILGVDLMDYSPGRVERGSNATTVEDAIGFAERGGIVTFCWHWNPPAGVYDTEEQPWYTAFYTQGSDFNISTAMADTTNANYTLLIRDIDAIAVQLKRLQDAHVPVLFRPLHEAEGGWFWWGAEGPEPCKKLWNVLYERLTEFHNLDNLIWIWNSVSPAWYPGDETVDILTVDAYADDHGPLPGPHSQLLELGEGKKMIAAAEVGRVHDVDLQFAYQTDWLYFCTWNEGFINNEEVNPLSFLEEVYNDDYVLTLEDIQGWREQAALRRL